MFSLCSSFISTAVRLPDVKKTLITSCNLTPTRTTYCWGKTNDPRGKRRSRETIENNLWQLNTKGRRIEPSLKCKKPDSFCCVQEHFISFGGDFAFRSRDYTFDHWVYFLDFTEISKAKADRKDVAIMPLSRMTHKRIWSFNICQQRRLSPGVSYQIPGLDFVWPPLRHTPASNFRSTPGQGTFEHSTYVKGAVTAETQVSYF